MSRPGKDTVFKAGAKQAETARKGGIASGQAKRAKKLFRETVETMLRMTLKEGKADTAEAIMSLASVNGKNLTVQEAIMLAQVKKAMKGDTKAAEFIRDTIGQKPGNSVALSLDGGFEELDKAFAELEEGL